jgi:hypothetical protein
MYEDGRSVGGKRRIDFFLKVEELPLFVRPRIESVDHSIFISRHDRAANYDRRCTDSTAEIEFRQFTTVRGIKDIQLPVQIRGVYPAVSD